MTRFIVSLLVLLTASAPAIARPSTLGMSCRQAQGLVAAQGAVVMSTGRNTFDRFVANPGYCMPGEWAHSATAPTQDAATCPLGYTCDSAPPLWFDDDDHGGLFGH